MIRTLLTLALLAAAFSNFANAAANQRSCPSAYPVTLSYGDDVTGCALTVAGQIALMTFQGNTGDHITIVVTASGSAPCFGLYDPTGTKIAEPCASYIASQNEINADFTLPVTGLYTLRIHDSRYVYTYSFAVMLDCWYPTVVASPLTTGLPSTGTTVNNETTDDWIFSGTTGEDLMVVMNSGYGGPCFIVLDPTGGTVGSACGSRIASQTQARGEFTLPAVGVYDVRVYSSGYGASGTYSLLAQCLASCPAPGPVYPTITVALTGCTTACTNGNIFSATLSTVNLPNKTTELKLGFILPDGSTAAVGDPHLEIPGQFTFNGQVLNGTIASALPRGSWSLCARIIELNHGQTLAASCQPFTIQ